ncbi:MAG: chromosome partition protein MukE [Myxococcales bacterium]
MSMETNQTFEDLAQVVEHELFPDVDLALRRGRHIDREDATWYGFLTDAQAKLEGFYRRYGAELVQRTDGFFFLLPSGDKLGRRHLSPTEMLVGQGLTLLYLEPATVEQGGITSRDQLLSQLSASMGTEQLMLAFNAKKKRLDERVAQEMVRSGVSQAVRRLASLGFVDLLPEERIRLRSSLMRFAEPVRGSGADMEALTRLVASGEVALTEGDDDEDAADDHETSPDSDSSPVARAAALPEWNEGSEWGASFDKSDSLPGPQLEAEPEREIDPALRTLPKAARTELDSELDSEPDTETETELETQTETQLDSEPEPDTERQPEPEPYPIPPPAPAPDPDLEPEPEPESEPDLEPEPELEPEPNSVDDPETSS